MRYGKQWYRMCQIHDLAHRKLRTGNRESVSRTYADRSAVLVRHPRLGAILRTPRSLVAPTPRFRLARSARPTIVKNDANSVAPPESVCRPQAPRATSFSTAQSAESPRLPRTRPHEQSAELSPFSDANNGWSALFQAPSFFFFPPAPKPIVPELRSARKPPLTRPTRPINRECSLY